VRLPALQVAHTQDTALFFLAYDLRVTLSALYISLTTFSAMSTPISLPKISIVYTSYTTLNLHRDPIRGDAGCCLLVGRGRGLGGAPQERLLLHGRRGPTRPSTLWLGRAAFDAVMPCTVIVGLREIRDLEGTHRFCHFLLSKLMCNGHLLNVSIPKSGKSQAGFSR
jgi:hypothetical protein